MVSHVGIGSFHSELYGRLLKPFISRKKNRKKTLLKPYKVSVWTLAVIEKVNKEERKKYSLVMLTVGGARP